jgi:hypothetical protein
MSTADKVTDQKRDAPDATGKTPEDINVRLDRVANTLIGATAAVASLLALLGVNNERVWILLDDDDAARLLVAGGALAIVAVTCSITALLLPARYNRRQAVLLTIGAAGFIGGLLLALFAAAQAADTKSMPSFTSISVSRSGEADPTVSFTVRAESLDKEQRIGVRVVGQATDKERLRNILRPQAAGLVEEEVTVPVPASDKTVILQAWREDMEPEPDCDGEWSACAWVVTDGDMARAP